MNPNHRSNVYELFGFDFLLDEDFRIWLIEVNYNPYLGTPNEYMKNLVPRMINDMLKIVLDPVIPPQTEHEPERENDFELIYRDANSKHGPPVNVRRAYSLDLVYPIPELKPQIGVPKVTPQLIPSSKSSQKKPSDLRLDNVGNGDYATGADGSMIITPRNKEQLIANGGGGGGTATPGRSKSLGVQK